MAEFDFLVLGHHLQFIARHFSPYGSATTRSFAYDCVVDDILSENEGRTFAVENIEMRRFEMGVEGSAIIINFIQKDLITEFAWNQYVEAPASRFIDAGVPRVFVYEFSESRHGTWFQDEINGDGKGIHLVASRTFQ
jgi:hypothetical protein